MARLCGSLLSDQASFLILNAYAARISGAALAGLLADVLRARGGALDWGELALVEQTGKRQIGLSFYARWTR
jgi:23S rRNA (cytosine1962-C5)-methyltransferase